MVGKIRTLEKCPECHGSFKGEPLRCPICKRIPTRYFIDLWWKKRHKLYSDQDGYPITSWEQASRFLAHIRYEVDRDQKSQGKFRFDPRNYGARDLTALKFENYVRTWFSWRAEEIGLPDGVSRGYLRGAESYARNHLLPFFEGMSIREIDDGQLEKFRRKLPRSLSAKTKHNIFGLLHKILRDALRAGDIQRIPEFPAIKFETPPIKWIDEEDQELFLAEVHDPVYRAFFLFLMKQGCRPNEARALKWDRVDWDRNQVRIDAAMDEGTFRGHTKTRDIRTLPIHPEVREALESIPTRALSGYVFTYKGLPLNEKTVHKTWRRVTRAAGLDISLYQGTKHSGGSQAINAGVPIKVIQKMMGHKDARTTARYLEVATETLKGYWDRPQTVRGAKKGKAKLLEFNKK
jgi:integrase